MRISDWSSDVCSSDLGASFEHLLTEIELEIFYGHTDIGLRDTQPLGRSTYTALFVNGTKRSDLPEVYSAHCSAPPQELIANTRDRRHEPLTGLTAQERNDDFRADRKSVG